MTIAALNRVAELQERRDELAARLGRAERRNDPKAAGDYRLALAEVRRELDRLTEAESN